MWTSDIIMMNGKLMPYADAQIHPLSLAVTYATTVFEGLRAYYMPETKEFALFRLDDHIKRLQAGMKVKHARFGEGKVLTISGDGADKKAGVFFSGIGLKHLLLKFAKLELIK